MSLDVYLQKDATPPDKGGNHKLVVQFNDNGYYWFLYPLFEDIEQKTGKMIELYEDAFFTGDSLNVLSAAICEAITLVSQKTDVWEEYVGTISFMGKRKIEKKKVSIVYKRTLELMLNDLKDAVKEAEERDFGIFFFGD